MNDQGGNYSNELSKHVKQHAADGFDPFVPVGDGSDLWATAAGLTTTNTTVTALSATVSALGLTVKQILFASADAVTASTSEADIVTQSVTVTAGQKVAIFATGKIDEAKSASPSTVVHTYVLKRDTTALDTGSYGYTATGTGSIATADQATFVWLETPGAGTFVYKVRGSYVNSSTSGVSAAGRILVAVLA